MKRDDCTGLAGGGNKTRKLEFLIAAALEADATVVVTPGAIQSNHARQTAAAAARFGLKCHLVLENPTGREDIEYLSNGNVLLDHLFGATIEMVGEGEESAVVLQAAADRLAESEEKPYVVPTGGSNEIGALGYVNAAMEFVSQANDIGLSVKRVVHATGSAGTQAGLVAGLAAMRSGVPTLGVSVMREAAAQEELVLQLAERTAAHIGAAGCVSEADVTVDSGYVGPGYGVATDGMIRALELVARTEGVILDPVYSGKAMAGLIDLVSRGEFDGSDDVVFLHTGGAQGLPAYRGAFEQQ